MTVNESQTEVSPESDQPPGSAPGGYRVSLGQLHTLVLCAGPELDAIVEQIRGAGGDATLVAGAGPALLLFRAPSTVSELSPAAASAVPRVWLELGDRSLPLAATELAGWEQPNSTGVALLRGDRPSGLEMPLAGTARACLSHAGAEARVDLPGGWLQHLLAEAPALAV